jgi:uncharacterized integral membrane protein (TIGR00698 family)
MPSAAGLIEMTGVAGLRARAVLPGLIPVALVALAASWLAEHYHAPVMLFALLLGMAINFLSSDDRCRTGIDFASRTLLRAGVALLGMRITLAQIESLGVGMLVLTFAAVALTIVVGWALARGAKLDASFGLLSGGAVAICGASAALAIAAVLPDGPAQQRATVITVVGVTALSTVAMIAYPLIAAAAGLDIHSTGIFLGATIHDVAQVVGAGYGVSNETGDTATIVKLFRVALLLPIVLLLSLLPVARGAQAARSSRPALLPAFLVAFAAFVALNSSGYVPPELTEVLQGASRWCLILAISALGIKTVMGELATVGWKPIALIVIETLFVGGFVLAALLLGLER